MESVWLLLGSGRDVGPVDPFGFSWLVALSLRKPPLTSLGFPWILSSESRFINGLRGINRGKFFLALLSWREAPERGRGHAEAQDCSWASLNLVSEFLQEIVLQAVPLRPPQYKSSSP